MSQDASNRLGAAPLQQTADVRVAVVIPAYGQPGLLPEALDAALGQRTDFAVAVILVNDGCSFEETDWVCREFAAARPGLVFYLNRRNGGLSAARNRSEEHTSELQSLMRISYAVFCLTKKNKSKHLLQHHQYKE